MADSSAATAAHHGPSADVTKRDFLQLLAGAGAAIGAAAIAWPLIDSMNPSKDVLALSSVDVELAPIEEGQGITIVWQGKPIFVRHRTANEIKEAEDVQLSQLADPQTDAARVKAGHDQWIVLIRAANGVAGSARATAASMILRAVCATDRRRLIWRFRLMRSRPIPRSRSADQSAAPTGNLPWPACTRAISPIRY